MDLQHIFYITGIIFMILAIIILIGIAVLVFYIRKKVGEIHKFIEIRINELTAISLKPIQKTAAVAASLFSEKKTPSKTKR